MTKTSITKQGFDLEERTLVFAKDVIRLCKSMTQSTINRELVSQLVRASGSVGANYREANDALSKKDFGHRIRIARREAKEAHYWLQLLEEAGSNSDGQVRELLQEALELKKILSSIAEKVPY
ncbi:MAG: four helix bundle protein [Candidatus Omnitrophica bacterium]|nr:four helix bundle protein [Candidatus Omnitrophota bacterium]